MLRKIKVARILAIIPMLVLIPITSYTTSDGPGVSPEQAMQNLKDGNHRFYSGPRSYPNLDQKRRDLTSTKGQHPFATVIACSDSRVPVEHLFDAGIGDIFTIRVAGNVCDTDEIGSIEYGVVHLQTPILVVLGHSSCGAVTAVTRGDEVHGSIPPLVDNIIPAAKKAKKKHGNEFTPELLDSAIKLNVWNSIEELYKKSHGTVELVKNKKLDVVGAIYNLDTGTVEWLGKHPKEAKILLDASSPNGFPGELGIEIVIKMALALAIIVLVYLAIYLLFFMRRGKKKVKVQTRLLAGFISLIIVILLSSVSVYYIFLKNVMSHGILPVMILAGAFMLVSIIFAILYIRSVTMSFTTVISSLKARIAGD